MNEQAGFLSSRFRVGAFFVAALVALASLAGASAQGSGQVVWINLNSSHVGDVEDRVALHEVLRGLGALPEGPGPVVVSVQTLDATIPSQFGVQQAFQEVISRVVREAGGEEPVFVAAPWGRPREREARGGHFPTTPEEFEELGYGWILEQDGFRLAWDHDSEVAELVASRGFVYGMETLSGVHLYVCVDGERVRGWARSWAYRGHRVASDATVGRFTRDCLQDSLGMPDEYVVPENVRTALGLDGWFAVLLPNAFAQQVPVGVAVESAREVLALANVPIPLHLVAVETVTEDLSELVTRNEHETMLMELGVSVDGEFQSGFPAWVRDFATHYGTILVLFDDTGRAVGHYIAGSSDGLGRGTLVETLMLEGLF